MSLLIAMLACALMMAAAIGVLSWMSGSARRRETSTTTTDEVVALRAEVERLRSDTRHTDHRSPTQ